MLCVGELAHPITSKLIIVRAQLSIRTGMKAIRFLIDSPGAATSYYFTLEGIMPQP